MKERIEREHRGADVHGRVGHAEGGLGELRRDAEHHQHRDEDGRKDRPLGGRRGDEKVEHAGEDDDAQQRARRRHSEVLEELGARDGEQRADARLAEDVEELGGEEGEHHEAEQHLHDLFHRLDHVGRGLEGACGVAVDDAGEREEDEDERNDGLHDGGLRAREGAVGRAQHGAFGPAEHEEQGGEAQEDRAGLAVGAVLKGAHGRNPEVGIVLEALVERHRGPEARLDDLVGHVPAGGDHEEGAAEREEVVAEHVHRVGRIERLGGGLGEGLHDGVDHGRRVGGREAARETGERAGHAREQ